MFSEIAFVFCAILAIQASLGFCLPSGKSQSVELETESKKTEPEIKDDEDEDGYYVVLRSPTQALRVQVVEEDDHRTEDEELASDESSSKEDKTDKIKDPNKEIKEGDEEESTKCNWRRLYKLYVKKKKATEGKNFYFARERRKELRHAFRVICDNPEEVILQLLDKNDNEGDDRQP